MIKKASGVDESGAVGGNRGGVIGIADRVNNNQIDEGGALDSAGERAVRHNTPPHAAAAQVAATADKEPATHNSDDKDHEHAGHRQRLRARFLKDEGASMADYELLELLLTFALPRIDTKPLAKSLLREHGNLAGVITADPAVLGQQPRMGAFAVSMIKLTRAVALRLLRQDISRESHVINSWDKLLAYLYASMAHEKREELRLLHLNHRFLLMADEKLQQGTTNHTAFYVREIVKRALEVGSSHVIIVHNHPSGHSKPSPSDILETKKLAIGLRAMDISLHDHLIISQDGHYSFKANGLL
ncbi:MAG: DNA repair protein RadC [Alphaproteobacteria bacterium]|nr:DNA repair protein RadC [Alphaproteobacteria bacterium]